MRSVLDRGLDGLGYVPRLGVGPAHPEQRRPAPDDEASGGVGEEERADEDDDGRAAGAPTRPRETRHPHRDRAISARNRGAACSMAPRST